MGQATTPQLLLTISLSLSLNPVDPIQISTNAGQLDTLWEDLVIDHAIILSGGQDRRHLPTADVSPTARIMKQFISVPEWIFGVFPSRVE